MTGQFSVRPQRVETHTQRATAVLMVLIVLWGSCNAAGFPLNAPFGVFLPESQGQKLQGLQGPDG